MRVFLTHRGMRPILSERLARSTRLSFLPQTHTKHELLAEYRSSLRIPVYWGQHDRLGHVNNTHFAAWYENARVHYFEEMSLSDAVDAPPNVHGLLVALHINYRRSVVYPDAVEVGVRFEKIGRSSFTMGCCVVSLKDNAVVSDGYAVLVAMDMDRNSKVELPPEFRQAIEAYEGRSIPS